MGDTGALGLTRSTVLYLFADRWVQSNASLHGIHVPAGAKVDAQTLVHGLLHAAFWSLREDGLARLELMRPAGTGKVITMVGPSHVRLSVSRAERGGLEGALLECFDEQHPGVRQTVERISNVGGYPWKVPAKRCTHEAIAAGLVQQQGRLWSKRPVADGASLTALAPRYGEVMAAWESFKTTEAELSAALSADLEAGVAFHQRS